MTEPHNSPSPHVHDHDQMEGVETFSAPGRQPSGVSSRSWPSQHDERRKGSATLAGLMVPHLEALKYLAGLVDASYGALEADASILNEYMNNRPPPKLRLSPTGPNGPVPPELMALINNQVTYTSKMKETMDKLRMTSIAIVQLGLVLDGKEPIAFPSNPSPAGAPHPIPFPAPRPTERSRVTTRPNAPPMSPSLVAAGSGPQSMQTIHDIFPHLDPFVVTASVRHELPPSEVWKLDRRHSAVVRNTNLNGVLPTTTSAPVASSSAQPIATNLDLQRFPTLSALLIPLSAYFRILLISLSFVLRGPPSSLSASFPRLVYAAGATGAYFAFLVELSEWYEWPAVLSYHMAFHERRRVQMAAARREGVKPGVYIWAEGIEGWEKSDAELMALFLSGWEKARNVVRNLNGTPGMSQSAGGVGVGAGTGTGTGQMAGVGVGAGTSSGPGAATVTATAPVTRPSTTTATGGATGMAKVKARRKRRL